MLQLIRELCRPKCSRQNSSSPFRNKAGALLFVAALIVAGFLIPTRFAVTVTPSLPYHLFFVSGDREPAKNDYIVFEKVFAEVAAKPQRVIKKVSCIGGEDLKVVERQYFCGGVYLGVARERTPSGKPVNQFIHDGRIPKGKLFVMGTHSDSYDSRYYGFIDRKDVKSIVRPII